MTNYILFPTTRTFIRGMKVAEAAGIPHKVVAVPTHITHQCGMCLQMEDDAKDLDVLTAILEYEQIGHKIISEQ
ncbi:MAG: DUF3343 domain-containing protein [Porphyromonadaceae bacterium]|nr:DUF3343 domain-containing protein [Porphyromonadaceae bacterium]